MKYVNEVNLIGNVVNDPENKSPAGKPVMAMFRIATNRDWKDQTGAKHSLPEYHQVVAWGGLADHILRIVAKAKLVYVQGYLKTHIVDHGGIKSHHTEVVAETIIVLSKAGEVPAETE